MVLKKNCDKPSTYPGGVEPIPPKTIQNTKKNLNEHESTTRGSMNDDNVCWKCPDCTLLVPSKFYRCTVCLCRKPRRSNAASFTPPMPETNEETTPESPKKSGKRAKKKSKNNKRKAKRKVNFQEGKNSSKKSKCYQKERISARVDKHLNSLKKSNKHKFKKRGDYDVHDVRRGLMVMLRGFSAHEAAKDVGVPVTSLRRNWTKCVGSVHRKGKVSKAQWEVIEKKIANYDLQKWGGKCRKLLPDEEELIVCACEFAAKMCFPWSPLEVTRLGWNMMQKIKPGCPCPSRGWLRSFEKRWKARLAKCKSGSIDPARARAATPEVRDQVFENFVAFKKDLEDRGELTPEQLTHLQDFMINYDEVGGDELGKRSKTYQPTNSLNVKEEEIKQWRYIEIGGDHNPFHCTTFFGTFANGTIGPGITIIHSVPGCKSTRVRSDLIEGLPGQATLKLSTPRVPIIVTRCGIVIVDPQGAALKIKLICWHACNV